ncbi:MAG: HAD family phosphatase [Clostridia bacterium]|nr:HAD family phosphatase [Clostridia bacterium]
MMENEGVRLDERFRTMPWDMIDAVVFDIGNVLMRYAPAEFVRASFPDDEKKQKEMLARVFEGKYWRDLDRGSRTHDEVARLLVSEYGGSYEDYLFVMTDWSEKCVLLEEGWRAAERCKAKGKGIYLLSNYNGVSFKRLMERFGNRFSMFDGGFISYEELLLKPERAIYQALVNRYALTPGRLLFIDDTLDNVEGAMRAGLNGFRMNREGKMDGFFVD